MNDNFAAARPGAKRYSRAAMRSRSFLSVLFPIVLTAVAVGSGCGSNADEPPADGGSGGGAAVGGAAGHGQGGSGALAGSTSSGGSTTGGNGGAAGDGGNAAGGSGGGADAGADADIPDVTFNYDGPVDDGSIGDACAAKTVQAELAPLDMIVMLDRSGSMSEPGFAWYAPASDCNVSDPVVDSKWCRAVHALGQYFQSSSATNNRAALQYFPLASAATCPASGYATPAVGLTALPGGAAALVNSLNAEGPLGTFTPTQDAIVGANTFSGANLDPKRKMISVLITDGKPNTCPESTGSGLAQILSNHFTATGVPTYVIGMTGADFDVVETIAAGGGTKSHADNVGSLTDTCGNGGGPCYHWNVGNGDPTVFVEALKIIQQQALGCTLDIPTVTGGIPDWNKVELHYSPAGQPPAQNVPHVSSSGQCSGDGWYYDNNSSPTKVTLCPSLCSKVQQDFSAKIELALGCLGS
jgi:hypothetical protein